MRKIYYALVIGFVLLLMMWTCMTSMLGDMCGNQIISEELSPNKKYKVVVFVRDCGATTGFSTQVSILENGRGLRDDESGNILTISDHYNGGNYNSYGGAEVKAEWTTDKRVLIQFDTNAEIGTKEYKVKGIEITYNDIQ